MQRQVIHAVHAGWRPPSTARSRPPAPCLRPSSCCRGVSRKRAPPKSTWRRTQHVGHGGAKSRSAVLPIITGGGKWVEMTIPADPLYQHLLLTAERKFWRCVESGAPPRLFGIEPPRPKVEATRTLDISGSNAGAGICQPLPANPHRCPRPELKALVPEDVREALGHGVRAKRSKSGAISFEPLKDEPPHAAL